MMKIRTTAPLLLSLICAQPSFAFEENNTDAVDAVLTAQPLENSTRDIATTNIEEADQEIIETADAASQEQFEQFGPDISLLENTVEAVAADTSSEEQFGPDISLIENAADTTVATEITSSEAADESEVAVENELQVDASVTETAALSSDETASPAETTEESVLTLAEAEKDTAASKNDSTDTSSREEKPASDTDAKEDQAQDEEATTSASDNQSQEKADSSDEEKADNSGDEFADGEVDDGELGSYRAASGVHDIEDVIVATANASAIMKDNKVEGTVITGDNIISTGAFENSAGFSSVIQNSGPNSIIQANTLVVLNLND